MDLIKIKNDSSGCCSGNSGCCVTKQEKSIITIDFLYLDLSICERCQGAENNLDEAINEVSIVLKAAGYDIVVNKVNITTEELAVKYEFISSPTIRINGKDIAVEVIESSCKECGDLCGDNVDCRVWSYEGEEYTQPPKALILNAILKEIYTNVKMTHLEVEKYIIPNNLKVFFDGKNK